MPAERGRFVRFYISSVVPWRAARFNSFTDTFYSLTSKGFGDIVIAWAGEKNGNANVADRRLSR